MIDEMHVESGIQPRHLLALLHVRYLLTSPSSTPHDIKPMRSPPIKIPTRLSASEQVRNQVYAAASTSSIIIIGDSKDHQPSPLQSTILSCPVFRRVCAIAMLRRQEYKKRRGRCWCAGRYASCTALSLPAGE